MDSLLSQEFLSVTQTLAENLAASEPIVRYAHAKKILNNDAASLELLAKLSAVQAGLRNLQLRSAVTQSDIDELRSLQDKAQTNPIIVDYAQAQQNAVASLREINVEISQLIGLDFAALARRSSCC